MHVKGCRAFECRVHRIYTLLSTYAQKGTKKKTANQENWMVELEKREAKLNEDFALPHVNLPPVSKVFPLRHRQLHALYQVIKDNEDRFMQETSISVEALPKYANLIPGLFTSTKFAYFKVAGKTTSESKNAFGAYLSVTEMRHEMAAIIVVISILDMHANFSSVDVFSQQHGTWHLLGK